MHNNGHPFIPDNPARFQSLQLHAQQIHANIFWELPNNVLTSIGWTCCYPTCPSFFLGTTDLTTHQQTCQTFQSMHTAIPDFSSNPAWALAFAVCPTTCTNDLNKLINDSPDNTTPQAILPTILLANSQWCYDTQSPPNESTTVTSHTHND